MTKIMFAAIIGVASILATGASAQAQQPPVKRTILQTVDFPPGLTTVTYLAEITPGSCSGRHTHPSIETSYVIEGTMYVKVTGKPDQTFKAGDSVQNPAGIAHDVCAAPGQTLKIISNQVVGKDTPLASPAP